MNEKAKYFSLYLGQKVVTQKMHPVTLYPIGSVSEEVFFRGNEEESRTYENFQLALKRINDINKEEVTALKADLSDKGIIIDDETIEDLVLGIIRFCNCSGYH